jgi:hypothetical protein
LKTILAHWRSTLAGLAMILAAAARVHSGADLVKADIQAEILGGVGLILAADAAKEQRP